MERKEDTRKPHQDGETEKQKKLRETQQEKSIGGASRSDRKRKKGTRTGQGDPERQRENQNKETGQVNEKQSGYENNADP